MSLPVKAWVIFLLGLVSGVVLGIPGFSPIGGLVILICGVVAAALIFGLGWRRKNG